VSTQPLCTRSGRKFLLAGTVALVLAIPGTAHCFTLNQLLDMPIEQLLRLKITSRHLPQLTAPRAVEHRDAT
jgi:hypothetical protein